MLAYRRGMRRLSAALVMGALITGSCSDSGPGASPLVTLAPGPDDSTGGASSGGTAPSGDVDVDAASAAPSSSDPFGVSVSVEASFADLDASLNVQIDPAGLAAIDPFARFAACSGLRRSLGVYSVLVSDPDGPFRSASLLTVDRVTRPGTHDADVRVEPRAGDPISAVGTLTIGNDLRSGSFVAFDAAGNSVTGSFRCDGVLEPPSPISPGRDDNVLDTVEVFVLLRQDAAERIIGFAVDATVGTADVECPAAVGAVSELLVRVDGDRSVGAVTTFELVDGPDAAMRMRAGGSTFEFDAAEIVIDGARTSGSFSATSAEGVSADGAFSCT
jgi:hypothetical protein